jgi:ParB family chromosome partitioning protein
MKTSYKTIDISALTPYAKNSRTHSERQIEQIADSIKEFGFLNPIIIDENKIVIAGHGRLLAAQKLGIEKVPVVETKHLTEAQRRAYVIADNNLALSAGWDTSILLDELSLIADDFDLSLVGFDNSFIDDLATMQDYAPLLEPSANYHEVTQDEIDKTQSRLSTAFSEKAEQQLHKVICPNCAEEFSISKA